MPAASRTTPRTGVGALARTARQRAGLSLRAAAAHLGYSFVTVEHAEQGRALPGDGLVEAWAEVYGADLAELRRACALDRQDRARARAERQLRRAEVDLRLELAAAGGDRCGRSASAAAERGRSTPDAPGRSARRRSSDSGKRQRRS